MKPVNVPVSDVNSTHCILVRWFVQDGAAVRRDQVVAEVETSKSVIDVPAPDDGFMLRLHDEGTELPIGATIAQLFSSADDLEAHRDKRQASDESETSDGSPEYHATQKAQDLARQHGIDLATLNKVGLITAKDVEQLVRSSTAKTEPLQSPLKPVKDVERVLIIGGGLGATQVLDILHGDPDRSVVAIIDDSSERWADQVGDVPIVGGRERLAELYRDGLFDSAVVSISTSIPARTKFRELCKELDVPMANAIDHTARIAADVKMGTGNVVCAFCHFGAGAVVGDNNFFSAYNSFDHHCTLGSDMSTGPACVSSGIVKIGDRVRMGTGIFIEPYLEIGDDAQIASGAVIRQPLPAGHVAKMRTSQTVIMPLRSR